MSTTVINEWQEMKDLDESKCGMIEFSEKVSTRILPAGTCLYSGYAIQLKSENIRLDNVWRPSGYSIKETSTSSLWKTL